jgi:hypothetical protein
MASSRQSKGGGRKRSASSGRSNGRSSTARKRSHDEFEDYSVLDREEIEDGPDVLLDVPVVKVDEISLEVDDLRAKISVNAEVRGLVELSVGAEASLGKVELEIQGVEAQALVKARLDNVSAILDRVLLSLDRNPQLLESVGEAVERVGGGAGKLLAESGEAVEEVGEGTEDALGEVGGGAGRGVGQIGQGAGQGLEQLGGKG